MFPVENYTLHDTVMESNGEHATWYRSYSVSKEEWEKVKESISVAIPPIPPVVATFQNDAQYMIEVDDMILFRVYEPSSALI